MGKSEYPSKVSPEKIALSLYEDVKSRFKQQLDAYKEEIKITGGANELTRERAAHHIKKLSGIYIHLQRFYSKPDAKNMFIEIIDEAKKEAMRPADNNMAGIKSLAKQFQKNLPIHANISERRYIALACEQDLSLN